MYGTVICHHGIKGQKWGVRRFQNEDGTLTPEGQKKYGKKMAKREEELAKLEYGSEDAAKTIKDYNERLTNKALRKSYVDEMEDYFDDRKAAEDYFEDSTRVGIEFYTYQKEQLDAKIAKIKNTPIDKMTPTEANRCVDIWEAAIGSAVVIGLPIVALIAGSKSKKGA